LAVGVSYTVHIVTIFLRHLEDGGERCDAVEHAMRHSGLPILMTAVTTATGMLSFLAAQMKPILEMGLLAALGTLVSLVYALVLLPALLALFPIRAKRRVETPIIDRVLSAAAGASARHALPMLGATVVLAVAAGLGMTLLVSSADPVSWFPKDHPFYRATHTIKDEFGGTLALEILLDTERENGLQEPAVMNRLEDLSALVEEFKAEGAQLSHTISVADIAKETHQALNANDPRFYAIPQDRELLAQELLLFENGGTDDLEQVVDPQFRIGRFTVRSKRMNGVHTSAFIETAEPRFIQTFGDAGTLRLTGMSAVISRTIDATMESMLRSYALALAMITPLMILLIGSLRAGLVSMVPNLVPILMTLGVMGITGIPIDMFTLLAGCIAIGLAVDDSIHFISSFRRYLAVRSVELTMETTGRALLFTSVVLTTGFLVLTLSGMINLQQVGFLTAFAITSAFVLDITVTPALLVLTHRKRS
jgi:predicted RND superfamily exporter protein